MKWIWLIGLGVLVPLLLALAIGLTLARPGLPPAAQNALDEYLTQQAGPPQVQTFGRAAHPQMLSAALSRASYGGSYYFNAEGRPAPFPPTEVWCVTLTGADTSGGAAAPHTVFVAEHEDMYVGTWIVHEPSSADAVGAVCK